MAAAGGSDRLVRPQERGEPALVQGAEGLPDRHGRRHPGGRRRLGSRGGDRRGGRAHRGAGRPPAASAVPAELDHLPVHLRAASPREVPVPLARRILRSRRAPRCHAGRAGGGPGLAGARRLGLASQGRRQVGRRRMSAATAPKVFISYRRRDAPGQAGRLYDSMASRFEESNVFMDVDMAPGVDFVERIREAVGACQVLLVVMGPNWVGLLRDEDEAGSTEAEDFVRLEVETALRRPDVTVIPVLVAGAGMPEPNELPEDLRPLARRNALELSDMRWRFHVQRLPGAPNELIADTPGVHEVPPPPARHSAERSRPWFQFLLEGILVAVTAGLIARGLNLALRTGPDSTASDGALIADAALWRGEIWALVGAGLAVWLTFMRGEPRDAVRRAVLGLLAGFVAG